MNKQLSFSFDRANVAVISPPHNGTDTSRAAAHSVASEATAQRERVYAYIRSCGALGATDQEIESALNLGGNTVRPRRGELESARHGQRIRCTEMRRATAAGRLARVYVCEAVTA